MIVLETVIQSLIVAAVVAGATGYVSVKVMEVKVNGLRDSIQRLETEVIRLRDTLHEWAPHIGWVDQQRRHDDSD